MSNYGDECIFNGCLVIDGELVQCYENGDIVIPPQVERIKCDESYSAFNECSITSLTIYPGLKEIWPNTFSQQSGPISIRYLGMKTDWEAIQGKANLLSCISMRSTVICLDGVWKIPDILVENKIIMACLNKASTSITIPEDLGAEILLEYSFVDLPLLQSLTLPDSLLAIDNYATVNCPALKEVYIPSGINFNQIPAKAFEPHTHPKRHIYNW